MLLKSSATGILFPEISRQAIVDHCHRALKTYRQEGAEECKAFGLVCGTMAGGLIRVADCLPLRRNVRSLPPYKEYMDNVMAEYAVPSETPLHKRGWVADPAELLDRLKESSGKGQTLLGTYHMHRVAWGHDPVRDTPTRLDTLLARDSRLLMFIVSMVDPANPIIRAFYEGIPAREIPIKVLRLEIGQADERRKATGSDC